MTSPVIMRLMALSINAAKRAGVIIRDIMQKGELNVIDKGINDPQTEADRSAERTIIASLKQQFPNIKVIGEEGGNGLNVRPEWVVQEGDEEFLKLNCPTALQNIKVEDLVVWVDPLDGTSEYTQGFLEHVTVLIGIACKESAIAGVIHQPYYKQPNGDLGRTIWGLKGLGAGGASFCAAPCGEFIITTTRSHSNATVQAALDALTPTRIIKVGGAGYKVLQLLEGKAHAYVFASAGCKKWDTCAPEAVLEAAVGGCLTDMFGEHYQYHADVEHPNARGVLATNGKVSHSDIVGKLPQGLLEAMSIKKNSM